MEEVFSNRDVKKFLFPFPYYSYFPGILYTNMERQSLEREILFMTNRL